MPAVFHMSHALSEAEELLAVQKADKKAEKQQKKPN